MKDIFLVKDDFVNSRFDRWFRRNLYKAPQSFIEKHLRRGNIKRSEALKFIIKNEGSFPTTYLDKKLEEILSEIEMSLDQFIDLSDKFTNKKIFKTLSNGNLKKDNNLNLTKINYDN